MEGPRSLSAGTTRFVWTAAALSVCLYYFLSHPPRPAFGPPAAADGAGWGAAVHAAWIGAALLFAGLLVGGGRGAARLLRVRDASPVLLFVLGALLSSLLSFFLIAAGLFRPLTLGGGLFAFFLAAGLPRRASVRIPSVPRSFPDVALGSLAAIAFLALLVRVLAPLTANDPIVYHMPIAKGYATTGGFGGAPDLVYARMPHASDLLFAGAFLFGGEGGARVFHLLLAAACAALAARLARETVGAPSGLGAGALFLTLPLVLDPRTIGNVDLAAALFFGASFLFLVRHERTGKRADLAAGSLLAGGMLATKYSTYAAYPLLLALLLLPVLGKRRRPASWRGAIAFVVLSHAPLVPWLLKGWAETGNPLFPLFPSLLGGRGWDALLGERLLAWQRSIGMGRDPIRFLLLPWNAIVRAAPGYPYFDGALSPALLLWAPWVWFRGGRPARGVLLLALAGIYAWGIGSQQLRFLLPVVLLLASASGGFRRTERGSFGMLQNSLFVAIAAALLAPFVVETVRDTIPVVAGRESESSYLRRKVQSHEAFEGTAQIVPEGERVLLVWENRVHRAPRPFEADSFFEASEIVRLAETSSSETAFLNRLKSEGIRWVLVNRPLQRVFARHSPPAAVVLLDRAWALCEPRGAWAGLELYRIP
ncbi:MAG: glycosyltransferase family 39 protein [Candidatus Eisenbacteria bacterium]